MRCLGSPQRPAFRILILFPLLLISIAATAQMSLSASNVSFGSVQAGSSAIVPVAVTNTGKQTITISQATVSGSGFSFVGPNLPITVAPQHSVSLSISFAPQTTGSIIGNLSISYSASWGGKGTLHSSSVTVALSGTGQAAGYLTAPSSMNLGSVAIGSSQVQALTISNSGGASVAISGATVNNSGFSVSGLTFPYTLPAGGSASLSVTFTPSSTGTDHATLSISSNASNSPFAVSLTGTTPTAGYLSAPASLSLGSVAVGSSRTQALALSNSGGSSLTISGATVSGTGFSVSGLTFPYTLPAGGSASLSVSFTPSTAGTDNATLSISSNASNSPVAVSLTGTTPTAGYLSAPASLSLGSVAVGSSRTQALTLSNSGGSSLTISGATVSGTGFSVSGLTFPYTLAAGGSASLSVIFTPSTAGTDIATLSLSSNASDPTVGVSLTGSGTTSSGTLGVTPGSMSFGSITIGTTQTQSGSLTASGGSVTVSSSSSSNSAFTLGGVTLPVTLAAGQNLPFTVTFAPTSTATASANISFFTSNSTSASETASGSGATIQHTVDLSWSASTSTSISGYNVYRGTVSGGPYTRITSALDFSLNYSDSTVQSGKTYYYVTTAVDSSGAESSYSSQVQAVIPFP